MIDMWDITPDYMVERMAKLFNSIRGLQHVIFATYADITPLPEHLIPKGAIGRHHPTIQSYLYADSTQVIPYNYDNSLYGWKKLLESDIENLLELERKYDFDSIIMCGAAWENCMQYRSYGIEAIRQVLPHKDILVHQQCIELQEGIGFDEETTDFSSISTVISSDAHWQPYEYEGQRFYKYCDVLEPGV